MKAKMIVVITADEIMELVEKKMKLLGYDLDEAPSSVQAIEYEKNCCYPALKGTNEVVKVTFEVIC